MPRFSECITPVKLNNFRFGYGYTTLEYTSSEAISAHICAQVLHASAQSLHASECEECLLHSVAQALQDLAHTAHSSLKYFESRASIRAHRLHRSAQSLQNNIVC